MPKIKYSYAHPAPVKADPFGELIHRYEKARKMTSEKVAAKLGTSACYYRQKKSKGFDRFTLEDLKALCDALDIAPADAAAALTQYLT